MEQKLYANPAEKRRFELDCAHARAAASKSSKTRVNARVKTGTFLNVREVAVAAAYVQLVRHSFNNTILDNFT